MNRESYTYKIEMAIEQALALQAQGWPWELARQHAAGNWGVFTTDIQKRIWNNRRRR